MPLVYIILKIKYFNIAAASLMSTIGSKSTKVHLMKPVCVPRKYVLKMAEKTFFSYTNDVELEEGEIIAVEAAAAMILVL